VCWASRTVGRGAAGLLQALDQAAAAAAAVAAVAVDAAEAEEADMVLAVVVLPAVNECDSVGTTAVVKVSPPRRPPAPLPPPPPPANVAVVPTWADGRCPVNIFDRSSMAGAS
jgi:hypothetical protein